MQSSQAAGHQADPGAEDLDGARLLNRTARRLSLTEVGTAFYKRAARILEAAEEAKIAAGALQTVPCGRLRINASVSSGLLHLAPAATEFLKRFPNWVAISSSRSAIDGEARGRDVHLPNRALKPTQSANTDEVRCTRNAVRSRARLEWLHPEVQRNSRVARAE